MMFAKAIAQALQYANVVPTWGNKTGPGTRNWHKSSGSIAKLNRHTGEPHLHQREIARRLRQAASSRLNHSTNGD